MASRGKTAALTFLILLVFFPFEAKAGVWPFSACGGEDVQKVEQKIAKEHNPISKARCQIALAKLELTGGIKAYDQKSYSAGKKLLAEYLDIARKAWETLNASGRDAAKSPQGFKEFEISLSENDRLLKDLAQRVPYPESDSIVGIEKASSAIHDEVVKALFPGLTPNSNPDATKKSKRGASSKGPA